MQHDDAVDSLLQAHSHAIEQLRGLCRSPGRHHIHQQCCESLAAIYKQALQKLTNMLTAPLLSHQLHAQHLQSLVQPALDMVLRAILHSKWCLELHPFLKACRRSATSPASVANTDFCHELSSASSSDGEDATILSRDADDQSWLLRVLFLGQATDIFDVHLHNFLIAFSAVSTALEDLNAQYMVKIAGGRLNPHSAVQSPVPDLFWRDQQKPQVLLVSGQHLDYVKYQDETFLNTQLEHAINLRGSSNDVDVPIAQRSNITITMATDAAQLAAFVKEKIRCAKQSFQESIGPRFLIDISKLEVVEIIADSFPISVHKVRWLGREFALKFYKKSMEEAFTHEAKIHVRLHHPNVVHAVALFKVGEKGYGILLELMDETLKSFLHRHAFSLSLQEKVGIMLQIAKAMAYVHERGLIHRDLKPSNVLVRSTMNSTEIHQLEVKVTDFGESRSRLPDSSSFKTKRIGTTVYRAPEVLNDDKDSFNFTSSYRNSADVYSFAMTCFELLVEKEPFHSAEKKQTLWEKVINGERPDLESISDGECPPYLKHCLETWWSDDPKRRHSFAHICCILRHLYACLGRCGKDTEVVVQFPFLAWPVEKWRKAQEIAQKMLQQFEMRRASSDWKEKGYVCESTRANEIPYELHVMNWAVKKAAEEREEAIAEEHARALTTAAQATNGHGNTRSRSFGRARSRSFGDKLRVLYCFSANAYPSNLFMY